LNFVQKLEIPQYHQNFMILNFIQKLEIPQYHQNFMILYLDFLSFLRCILSPENRSIY